MAQDPKTTLGSFGAKIALASSNNSPGVSSPDKGDTSDSFWHQGSIDSLRWNQSYPYQLLVLRVNGSSYVREGTWQFTLPIPPESLSISTPFAISTSVTLGGIIEEHNGAPIRSISMSGTTGVIPLKGVTRQPQDLGLAQAIFAGTLKVANDIRTAANGFVASFTSQEAVDRPNLLPSVPTSADAETFQLSGYYQFRLLQRFLEDYVNNKKLASGKNLRLALALWKDQSVYLVTPVTFDVQRTAQSPWEYRYNLAFRAWKRVSLDKSPSPSSPFQPILRDPNKLARLLTAISDARSVMQSAAAIFGAIGGDINHTVFEPLRQLSLFTKDFLAVPIAFADLPIAVLQSCRGAVLEYFSVLRSVASFPDAFRKDAQTIASLASSLGISETGNGIPSYINQITSDPAEDIFSSPENHYSFWSNLQPAQLNLPPQVIGRIATERAKVQTLTRLDFEKLRDSLTQTLGLFESAVGAGHDTYSETFGLPAPSSSVTPTDGDFDIIFAMNSAIMEVSKLAAYASTDRNKLSAMDLVAGLASTSGMIFNAAQSKFAVPFPYGSTLEMLAQRYLGDPDRWIELATLNQLRSPYVDEEGFDLPLLTNGSGNQVTVGSSANLVVGQLIYLSSTTTTRTSRRITRIEALSAAQIVLTLDGDSDLARFQTLAQATLHAFIPGTINSQMLLYIPSTVAAQDDDTIDNIAGVDYYNALIEAGGIDLLVTESGDAAIGLNGAWPLAVGLTNIVQKARTALSVTEGELLEHPGYGRKPQVGGSTADLDAASYAASMMSIFDGDPTFSGLQSVKVTKSGPGFLIGLSAGITGVSQNVVLSFNLPQ